jgi:hypothetical protein
VKKWRSNFDSNCVGEKSNCKKNITLCQSYHYLVGLCVAISFFVIFLISKLLTMGMCNLSKQKQVNLNIPMAQTGVREDSKFFFNNSGRDQNHRFNLT